jgi:hypothetical protein
MDIEILKVKDVSLKDVSVSAFQTVSVFERFNRKFDEIFKDVFLYSGCGMPLVLTPLQRVVMTPEVMSYINNLTMGAVPNFEENDKNIEKSISFDNWVRDLVFINGDGKYEKIPISHVVMNITTKLRTVDTSNGFGKMVLSDTEITVSVKYDKDRESSTIFDSFIDMIYG